MAETQKREWSSRPVTIMRSPPAASFTPPMMSICQSSMERLPFPTTIVLALAAPLLGIDEAVTDETAIDGGAPGKGVDPLAGEVVTDGARTPERMSPPQVQDAGID